MPSTSPGRATSLPGTRRSIRQTATSRFPMPLASASTSQTSAAESAPEPPPDPPGDIQERAEQIASAAGTAEEEVVLGEFLNRGFRNGVGGGFRNGGFGNGLGGGFRNGAFRNW